MRLAALIFICCISFEQGVTQSFESANESYTPTPYRESYEVGYDGPVSFEFSYNTSSNEGKGKS